HGRLTVDDRIGRNGTGGHLHRSEIAVIKDGFGFDRPRRNDERHTTRVEPVARARDHAGDQREDEERPAADQSTIAGERTPTRTVPSRSTGDPPKDGATRTRRVSTQVSPGGASRSH